jgi:ferredoxin
LMAAARAASSHWPDNHVRFEHFASPVGALADGQAPANGPFEVELASSGAVYTVPPDRSILSVLLSEGVVIESSCEAGVCGTCQTRYLAGNPEHRDFVLTDDEQREFMMICVSRARTPRLVLGL